MPEVIKIQNNTDNPNWNPFVGEETLGLLRGNAKLISNGNLNEAGNRVLNETLRIMQLCGNPSAAVNNDTGLIIGFVQSGKTLSFTTLTALARDNNYQIVIVLGGTSDILLNQSTERLRKDLRINLRFGFEQKWLLLKEPDINNQTNVNAINDALTQWRDRTFPRGNCKTILITVKKNGSRLENLANLLAAFNLEGVSTLIIDDEGDQASLNTRSAWAARQRIDVVDLTESQVSTIYRRINALRNILPHHTFLQYTATPQANLFINIMDRLSPNFIKLLTPGDEYTGGTAFFDENSNLIAEIPPADLPTVQPLHEAPNSLLRALKVFYLGVVAGNIMQLYVDPSQRNRSMLIHPSRLQGDHNTFYNWVNNTKESWRRLLSGEDNEDKRELLDEFQLAYNDLQITVENLPTFQQMSDVNLVHAIQYTPIVEVNSSRGPTPQINWQDSYSWILVGGQAMDRGFTVEGLTVTYMPRNVGVGNVDTIQQRARFFGYKRSYLGYCRVFLDQVTIDAYKFIIEHEEDVRRRLENFDETNRHLNDWDREAVLNQMLNLTRANILYDDIARDSFGNNWFRINAPHDTENFIETNRNALFDFLTPKAASFAEDEGHADRTESQKHLVARVPTRDCLDHLLNKLKFTRESDSATYSSLRGILKRYLQNNPDDECLIYLMRAKTLGNWKRRVRRLDRNDEIEQYFQGPYPTEGVVKIYPGDSKIKNDNILTVQIHLLDIRNTPYNSVPTLAIWIPERMRQDIIRQV